MARRLSVKQKEEIVRFFINGKSIDDLSISFKCTKLTISRNLKKNLGEKKYKELAYQSKSSSEPVLEITNNTKIENQTEFFHEMDGEKNEKEYLVLTTFTEITQNMKIITFYGPGLHFVQ